MNKKKLFTIFLSLSLALPGFAGCGKGEADAQGTPTIADNAGEDESKGNADHEKDTAGSGEAGEDAADGGGDDAAEENTPDIQITHIRDLSNPNATEKTKLVYDYLCSVTGQGIISGVEESVGAQNSNAEIQYIKKVSDKYPALRGFDFINDDFDGVVKRASFWGNDMKGLVTISWHWGTPPDGIGYESSKGSVDMDELLTEGSELYNAMIVQMDTAAEALKELQEAGVVVLWRPFHEFDGQWFWWGKGGSEKFITLWKLMYDRYTNHHGLNNLIWVLGYSSQVKRDWYPGDAYVDICGADSYANSTRKALYKLVSGYAAQGMPIPLHECDNIPDPDKLQEEGTNWTWFMTWTLSYLKEKNTKESLNAIFNHDYVITLDELPDFNALMEGTE